MGLSFSSFWGRSNLRYAFLELQAPLLLQDCVYGALDAFLPRFFIRVSQGATIVLRSRFCKNWWRDPPSGDILSSTRIDNSAFPAPQTHSASCAHLRFRRRRASMPFNQPCPVRTLYPLNREIVCSASRFSSFSRRIADNWAMRFRKRIDSGHGARFFFLDRSMASRCAPNR